MKMDGFHTNLCAVRPVGEGAMLPLVDSKSRFAILDCPAQVGFLVFSLGTLS